VTSRRLVLAAVCEVTSGLEKCNSREYLPPSSHDSRNRCARIISCLSGRVLLSEREKHQLGGATEGSGHDDSLLG
jgi:hypothetical protein